MTVLTSAEVERIRAALSRFKVRVMGTEILPDLRCHKLAGGDSYTALLSLRAWLPCALHGGYSWQVGRDWIIQMADLEHLQNTLLLAVEQFVRHEVHEGIRFNDKIIFNPHREEDHA